MNNVKEQFEQDKDFFKELKILCKKYNIINAAITGNRKNRYIGYIISDMNFNNLFLIVANIGRLWQHIRSVVREKVDGFEI